MTEKFIGEVELETDECCACGVTFAIPSELMRKRRLDHQTFYCPNGHHLHYPQQTKTEKLSDRLKNTQKLLADERACCIAANEEANRLERSLWGMKGYATKLKKQIEN